MKSITIKSPENKKSIMVMVWDMVGEMIKGGPVVITLMRESKSRDMEKKYHAMIRDISNQISFFGKKKYSADVWKALLVDQFEREKLSLGESLSHPGQTITSMDGQRQVTIRPSTTKFRKSEGAEFIEFLYMQGSEMGVAWSEPALKVYAEYMELQR
jgi:hypothetical protein